MTDGFSNRLRRAVDRLERIPAPLRGVARTLAFGQVVPYLSTTGVQIALAEPRRFEVYIPNRRRAQNHIRGLHACAMALAAETATGLLVGMNIPDRALPLIRTLRMDYLRRCKGGIRATALLDDGAVAQLRTESKGQLVVPVHLVDDEGNEPARCEAVWAWIPHSPRGGSHG